MSRRALAGWLVAHTRGILSPLLGAVAARVIGMLLGVALLVIGAEAILRARAQAPVDVAALVLLLVALGVVKAALRYLEHYAGHWVAFTALQRLRELLFARLVPQAPAATQGRAGAELAQRATGDIDRIEVFFAHTVPPVVAAFAVPAVAIGWLATVADPRLAAVVGLGGALTLALPFLSARASARAETELAARRGELSAQLGDDLQGIREVLGFDARASRLAALEAADRSLGAARARAAGVQARRAGLATVLSAGTVIGILAVGSAGIPAEQVVLALVVAVGLWRPLGGAEGFATGLDSAFAACVRVRAIVDADPPVKDPEDPLLADGAELAIDRVSFSYDPARAALDDVSLGFRPGSWSYLAGVSGSGKSTIATLLLRGWDPDSGEVSLGGAPLPRLALDELRSRIALVPQRPALFSGALADNLRLAAPDASDEAVDEALAAVGLDRWAASLPDGVRTRISARGVSGGQAQRIALARALVADPDVLVLDEALSQLDAQTAADVRTRLRERLRERCVIEITHRADLVPDDAFTAVIDGGRVVEQGPARTLRARGGAFVRLEARVSAAPPGARSASR